MTSVTQKRKETKIKIFLENLAMHGRVDLAAQNAGYADTSFIRRLQRKDEEFATSFEEAMNTAMDNLEAEAIRRATDGVDEPVYYRGEEVGSINKKSDQLLMFLLKGNKSKYREKKTDVNVNANVGIALLPATASSVSDWEQQQAQITEQQQETISAMDGRVITEDTETVVVQPSPNLRRE